MSYDIVVLSDKHQTVVNASNIVTIRKFKGAFDVYTLEINGDIVIRYGTHPAAKEALEIDYSRILRTMQFPNK